MPQYTDWYLEGRIIYVHYIGDVTLEDLDASSRDELALLDGVDHPVHILLDVTEQTSRTTDLVRVRDSLRQVLLHPNKGWTLMFGPITPRDEHIHGIITHLYHVHFRAFDTRQEALAFLAEADESLGPLLANHS